MQAEHLQKNSRQSRDSGLKSYGCWARGTRPPSRYGDGIVARRACIAAYL